MKKLLPWGLVACNLTLERINKGRSIVPKKQVWVKGFRIFSEFRILRLAFHITLSIEKQPQNTEFDRLLGTAHYLSVRGGGGGGGGGM